MLTVCELSIDHVKHATLIRCCMPRVSWKLESDKSNVQQTAYRVVFRGADSTCFDTGVVYDSSVIGHTIPDMRLTSRTEYDVTVHVWDNTGETATKTIIVNTEIMPEEWGDALWICPETFIAGWAPYLRTKFVVKQAKKAVLYASGLGCSEFYMNGRRIDDAYIDPPQSNYEKIVYYRRFDVTKFLVEGGNALAVWLGQGFYNQDRVWGYGDLSYGKVCAIARMEITLADGSTQVIVSDVEHWKAKYSPISLNNIYGGETYDCRLETPDFADYESSDSGWMSVVEDETKKGQLTPCRMEPVRVIRELPAVSVHGVSGKGDGAWVYDIGENIGGIVEIRLPRAPAGAVCVFRFGETLNAQGGVDLRSSGAFATQCLQQEIYICRGDEEGEVYRPRFCYHGFRYVEVTGIFEHTLVHGNTPRLDAVKGLLLSTDFEKTSDFSCENQDLNHLYHLMEHTYRSNYHGIPEDCPAREKCGWLGDAQLVSDFGLLTYDSAAAYIKFLDDIVTTKEVYGTWQMVAPGKRTCLSATPLWGCAQIILPYNLWKYTGDKEVILTHFSLMEEWVAHELERSENYLISEGLGDWLPIGGNGNKRRMPVKHSSTFIFYEICHIMEEICKSLQIGDDKYYHELAEQIRQALYQNFYNEETHTYGYLGSDGVALMLQLLPDVEVEKCVRQVLETLEKTNYEMPTSIYSNKYLVPAMFDAGYGEQMMRMLFGREHVSYGTMMDDNATSLWERLDMRFIEDRLYNSVSSYNHPMHGGFLFMCYTHLAGIRPLSPGYQKMEFRPCFVEKLGTISASIQIPYGKVSVKIASQKDKHICHVHIPTGAQMRIAVNDAYCICVNDRVLRKDEELGSGDYCVEYIGSHEHIKHFS